MGEVLKEFCISGMLPECDEECNKCKFMKQAQQELCQLILEELPKKDDKFYGMPGIDTENRGFNIAVERIEQAIKKICGVER